MSKILANAAGLNFPITKSRKVMPARRAYPWGEI